MGDRHMKYPYTFTAKIVQFPWKFHLTQTWHYRYWLYGMLASLPLFFWIDRKVNSPANKAKWAEVQKRNAEEDAEHQRHLKC